VVNPPAQKTVQKKAGQLRLAYIARIHPTKNTFNAIRWLSSVQGQVEFDIYGPIEDEDYWRQCRQAIDSLPENIRVAYRGMVDHDEVAETIVGYHGYYMPTTGENFGHSIVESLLVGRPVIISDQTPWTDIRENGGFVYPLTQPEAFPKAVERLCTMEQDEFDVLCVGAKEYISAKLNTEEIIAQYITAFGGE